MVEQAYKDRKYINVIATVEINEGKRDEYLAIFNANVPKVLTEDGCYEHNTTFDVEGSALEKITGPPRNNTVVTIEKWASLETLYAHLGAPHMK